MTGEDPDEYIKHLDPQNIMRGLQRYRNDIEYFNTQRGEISRRHPDMFVAIYNQQVVGADKDLEKLILKLTRRHIEPGNAYVERTYVRENPPKWILSTALV